MLSALALALPLAGPQVVVEPDERIAPALSADAERVLWLDPRATGTAVVTHVRSGRELARFGRPGLRVRAARLLPSGERVLTSSEGGRLDLWDLATARHLEELELSEGALPQPLSAHGRLPLSADGRLPLSADGRLPLSADGRRLVLGGEACSLVVVELDPMRVVATLGDRPGSRAWISPDGRRAIAADGLWDLEERTLRVELERGVWLAGFSEDGSRAYALERGRRTWILDAVAGAKIAPVGVRKAWPIALEWLPGGRELVGITGDGRILRFSADDGRPTATFVGSRPDDSRSSRILVSPDGEMVLGWGERKELWARSVATGEVLWERPPSGPDPRRTGGPDLRLSDRAFSRDGARVVVPDRRDGVAVLDPSTGREVRRFHPVLEPASHPVVHPGGERVALSCSDGSLRLVDVATGETGLVLEGLPGRTTSLVFTPDGTRLVASAPWVLPVVFDLERGELDVRLAPHPRLPIERAPILSVGNERVVGHDPKGEAAVLWHARTGRAIAELPLPAGEQVLHAVVDRAGLRAAVMGERGTVRLFDLPNGELLGDLAHPDVELRALVLRPDGRELATGGDDRMIRVFDTETLELARSFEHRDLLNLRHIESLDWSADGERILSTQGHAADAACFDAATGDMLWEIDHGAGNPSRFVGRFDPSGNVALLYGMTAYFTMGVDSRTGERLGDATSFGLQQVAAALDGERLLARDGDALVVFDDSMRELYRRYEMPSGERFLVAPSLHVDGPSAALAAARLRVGDETWPLACFTAVLVDADAVAEAAAGNPRERPSIEAPPELLVDSVPQAPGEVLRVRVLRDGPEPVRFEVRLDGRPEAVGAIGGSPDILELAAPVAWFGRGALLEVRALDAGGASSRPWIHPLP